MTKKEENPILANISVDANLYDLNEAYMKFLTWFYKDQFGYSLDVHARCAIMDDMEKYLKFDSSHCKCQHRTPFVTMSHVCQSCLKPLYINPK